MKYKGSAMVIAYYDAAIKMYRVGTRQLFLEYVEWLKPVTGYLLTEDELNKIIGDAFEAGMQYEFAKHFGLVPPISKNKEQYIQSITNQ